MHPEYIKARLRIAGSSQSKIARALKVSVNAVSYVITGNCKSVRIARRICEIARLDPEEAWPGRYPEFRVNPVRFSNHTHKEAA